MGVLNLNVKQCADDTRNNGLNGTHWRKGPPKAPQVEAPGRKRDDQGSGVSV